MDRGTHPRSMVGWSLSDHRVASVPWALGSRVAGDRLASLGCLAIALSFKRPKAPRIFPCAADRENEGNLRPSLSEARARRYNARPKATRWRERDRRRRSWHSFLAP